MINGAHVIIQSTRPEADRAFFRDVLELSHVDVGGGWLIFGLPPSEVAVHPSDTDSVHEFYLMCADVNVLVKGLEEKGIACGPIEDQGWGLLTSVTLPGGGKLGIYEPRHARPEPAASGLSAKHATAKARPPAKAAPKKAASKSAATKKPAPRAAAKKAAPKKPAPKKPVAKKPAPKRPAAKKPAPKKAAKAAAGRKQR